MCIRDRCPLNVALAEKVLKNVVSTEKKNITVEQIQKIVADHFRIAENSLRAKTRKQEIVVPRQIAMFLSKNLTGASLKTIGLHFGGRDHSTIIHACKAIARGITTDNTLRQHVEHLEKQISYIMR